MPLDRLVFLRPAPCERCAALERVQQELQELRRAAKAPRAGSAPAISAAPVVTPEQRATRRLFGSGSLADVPRRSPGEREERVARP
jgi:hypothetical protein